MKIELFLFSNRQVSTFFHFAANNIPTRNYNYQKIDRWCRTFMNEEGLNFCKEFHSKLITLFLFRLQKSIERQKLIHNHDSQIIACYFDFLRGEMFKEIFNLEKEVDNIFIGHVFESPFSQINQSVFAMGHATIFVLK